MSYIKATTEPNDDERKNGWTGQTLTQYLRQQEASFIRFLDDRGPPAIVHHGLGRYSPFRGARD